MTLLMSWTIMNSACPKSPRRQMTIPPLASSLVSWCRLTPRKCCAFTLLCKSHSWKGLDTATRNVEGVVQAVVDFILVSNRLTRRKDVVLSPLHLLDQLPDDLRGCGSTNWQLSWQHLMTLRWGVLTDHAGYYWTVLVLSHWNRVFYQQASRKATRRVSTSPHSCRGLPFSAFLDSNML